MAGYTLKNLKEVEDQAPKFDLSPSRPFATTFAPFWLSSAFIHSSLPWRAPASSGSSPKSLFR